MEKAEEYLNGVSQKISAKGIKVKTMVTVGHTAEEIVKAARSTKANLIAMSTHGRHGLSRWAFGSVTDKVVRESSLPMLVVRVPKPIAPG